MPLYAARHWQHNAQITAANKVSGYYQGYRRKGIADINYSTTKGIAVIL